MRDHEPLVINIFRGTFDRGEDEVCPTGFFISSLNWQFLKDGIRTRDGSSRDDISALIPANIKVRRMELYERTGEAQRLLILDDTGKIWDSVTGLVILSIPAMIDFSCTIMYERAFISPHNGITGLPGEKLYLYEGSGTARPAAGVGPSPTPPITPTDSALSGKCETGVHAFAVAFETSSGYISTLGGYIAFMPSGDHKLDIANIPLGPAGTVARVLFSTKSIEATQSDPTAYTYYFIPEGRVGNNTATTYTVDYYDADLADEASYLLEQLDEIPAGVGVSQYKASLIIWGENENPAVVRVSKSGEPEAHNGADGYLTVYPGVGLGIKNCVEYRNQLVMFKSHRTYGTMDNDDVPATWDIGEVDGSVGTECHGIGQILNIGSNIEDRIFVADHAGLRIFVGVFSDENVLTANVDDIWGRINKTAFQNVEMSIDAINFRIYIAVPLDGATTPNYILYGDYSDGIGEDSIKWTLWQFPNDPTSIVCSLVSGHPTLKFGSFEGYVFKLDDTQKLDSGVRIPCSAKFPLFPVGDLGETIHHFTGIRLRAKGVGTIQVTCEGLDGVQKLYCQSMLLTPLPGRPLWRGFNFTSEHCSVTLDLTDAGDWMIMTKFIIYPTPVWEGRAYS